MKKLKFLIVAAAVAVNAFVLSLLLFVVFSSKDHVEKAARTNVENIATLLEQDIGEYVSRIDFSLRDISDHLERDLRTSGRLDPKDMATLLSDRRNWVAGAPEFRVTNATGTFIFGSGLSDQDKVSIADRDYFQTCRDNPEAGLVVTNPIVGRLAKDWVILF
jgi:hypothetical protein